MNCTACGHMNPERVKFCLECGTPVAARCPSCGCDLPPAAKFCGECGASLKEVESRQWFVSDDFLFLFVAQKPKDWLVWTRTLFPFDSRLWWSYRPLTIDLFFHLCFRAFGLDPFGYILVSLMIHFCSGLIVYRLATQLGFDRRVAAVTALLSVSRYPSMADSFWISAFQHVGAKLLSLLTVSVFVDYARTGRRRYQLARVPHSNWLCFPMSRPRRFPSSCCSSFCTWTISSCRWVPD